MNGVRSYQSLGKLVTRLRSDLNDADLVLLYAYNRTGKTRLSMSFKDAGKRKNKKNPTGTPDTLYFNAFTEDLFVWENDLDGDRVRQMLSSGLGFDRASRELNVRRIGYVAAEIVRHGGIAICSPIAPFAHTREEVRHMVEQSGDFVLVHVSTPIEECERRDLKGLYAQARQGRIPDFTGISSPYDVPADADLRIDTSAVTREEAAQQVIAHLVQGGWVEVDPA